MKPVKFQSESDFAKSITTESKVFSIYAVGVVKGYKRETRVRVHTVVDFRTTQSLVGGPTPSASASNTPAPGAPPNAGGGGQTLPASSDPNAITTALQSPVGGQILYYNIE
jgi:general secretion pathway protein K